MRIEINFEAMKKEKNDRPSNLVSRLSSFPDAVIKAIEGIHYENQLHL